MNGIDFALRALLLSCCFLLTACAAHSSHLDVPTPQSSSCNALDCAVEPTRDDDGDATEDEQVPAGAQEYELAVPDDGSQTVREPMPPLSCTGVVPAEQAFIARTAGPVFELPRDDSAVLGHLPFGTRVVVISSAKESWRQIAFPNQVAAIGWVREGLLSTNLRRSIFPALEPPPSPFGSLDAETDLAMFERFAHSGRDEWPLPWDCNELCRPQSGCDDTSGDEQRQYPLSEWNVGEDSETSNCPSDYCFPAESFQSPWIEDGCQADRADPQAWCWPGIGVNWRGQGESRFCRVASPPDAFASLREFSERRLVLMEPGLDDYLYSWHAALEPRSPYLGTPIEWLRRSPLFSIDTRAGQNSSGGWSRSRHAELNRFLGRGEWFPEMTLPEARMSVLTGFTVHGARSCFESLESARISTVRFSAATLGQDRSIVLSGPNLVLGVTLPGQADDQVDYDAFNKYFHAADVPGSGLAISFVDLTPFEIVFDARRLALILARTAENVDASSDPNGWPRVPAILFVTGDTQSAKRLLREPVLLEIASPPDKEMGSHVACKPAVALDLGDNGVPDMIYRTCVGYGNGFENVYHQLAINIDAAWQMVNWMVEY